MPETLKNTQDTRTYNFKMSEKIKKNGRKNTKEYSTIKYRYMKKGDKENGRIRKRIY